MSTHDPEVTFTETADPEDIELVTRFYKQSFELASKAPDDEYPEATFERVQRIFHGVMRVVDESSELISTVKDLAPDVATLLDLWWKISKERDPSKLIEKYDETTTSIAAGSPEYIKRVGTVQAITQKAASKPKPVVLSGTRQAVETRLDPSERLKVAAHKRELARIKTATFCGRAAVSHAFIIGGESPRIIFADS